MAADAIAVAWKDAQANETMAPVRIARIRDTGASLTIGQKIYLSGGIYADMTSRFTHGKFEPMEWAFPDFKTGLYDQIFLTIRHLYKEKMKSR